MACDKERKLRLAAANAESTAQAVEEEWKNRAEMQFERAADEGFLEEEKGEGSIQDVEEDKAGADSEQMINRRLKVWFEGWLSGSMSQGSAEFVFLSVLPIMSLLGVLEAKLSDKDFLEALPQLVAEQCALIVSMVKLRSTDPDGKLSAFGIISNFKMWFIVHLTRLGKDSEGAWKTKVATSGPYQLYNLAKKELHPDARELLSHLCSLLIPSMQQEPRKVWEVVSQLFNSYHQLRAGERWTN